MKNRLYFNYEKQMTNEDIVEHAKIIAQASKEVKEIEEARKKLKDLHNTIARHSRYIQQGKIDFHCYGEFEWHRPVHNVVTVSSPYGDFRTYVRDMTHEEIEQYCELEIPFEQEDTIVVTSEEEAEKAKNRLKAVGWNVTDEELNEMVLIKDRVETEEDDRELSEIFGINETHALGGTDKYQIVEGPDGHLTTIPKEEAA